VTDRMLEMFRGRAQAQGAGAAAHNGRRPT
jgi:hypothetical protein